MASGSKTVIYAALIGNALIAVCKFVASGITGSSAMLSEAIHSCVDTGNQVLLLFGLKRADREADDKHPFGYGMELYFWAFVVAILIFAIGAGVSIYEGVRKLQNPHELTSPMVNYVVLILAMVFEGIAWFVAYKEFNKTRGKGTIFQAVRRSKDPVVFTVLFEDTAALLGLLVALVGVFCADRLGWLWADGLASVMIGLILAGAAWILAQETKGLLIGEAASDEVIKGTRQIVGARREIRNINELKTMHLGPNDVLMALSIDFQDELSSEFVEDTIYEFEKAIKQKFPEITRLFIEVQSEEDHARSLVEEQRVRRARLTGSAKASGEPA